MTSFYKVVTTSWYTGTTTPQKNNYHTTLLQPLVLLGYYSQSRQGLQCVLPLMESVFHMIQENWLKTTIVLPILKFQNMGCFIRFDMELYLVTVP